MKIGMITLLAWVAAIGHVCAAITTTDYIYRQTDGINQDLRAFFPDGWSSGDARTCVVLFHGGSWKFGDKSQFYEVCEYFAKRGWVAITANYRLLSSEEQAALPPGASIKTPCVKDAKSAIRWAKSSHAMLGIDPDRVITGGCSAGGHISVLAVLDDEHTNANDPVGVNTDVQALLLWNPAFDLEANESTPEVNVFVHYDKPLPPTIFMFGDQDGWKPASDELFRQMRGCGDTAHFWVAKDVGHNFWTSEPWLTHTILRADRFLVDMGFLSPGEIAQIPAANTVPASLRAFGSEDVVELNWQNVSGQPGFSGYNIYRSLQSGTNYQRIASNVVHNTYEDEDVEVGATYYYVVTAQAGSNESGFSNEYGATPLAIVSPGSMYHVTVNSGKGDNNYVAGAVVTLIADAAPFGQGFDKWVVNSGTVTLVNINAATTTFTMGTSAVTVSATYKAISTIPAYYTYTGGIGDWETSGNWSGGAAWNGPFAGMTTLPMSTDGVTLGGATVTLNSVQTIDEYRVGDRDCDPGGPASLTLASGAVLNTRQGTIGNNRAGTVTINAGAAFNHSGRLTVSYRGNATVHVYGTMAVGTDIRLQFSGAGARAYPSIINVYNGGVIDAGGKLNIGGDDGGTYLGLNGTLNILDGGVVKADGWNLDLGAHVVISAGGQLQIEGNQVAAANGYISAGYITSAGQISVIHDAGLNETSILVDGELAPTAPTSLVAASGIGSVSLDWADNGDGDFASYTIYRSTTSGSYGDALVAGVLSSNYIDNSVVNGTKYYYAVKATDSGSNESDYSNEDSALPPDLTGDDKIDLKDLAIMASQWQTIYDINDLSVIAENWLVF